MPKTSKKTQAIRYGKKQTRSKTRKSRTKNGNKILLAVNITLVLMFFVGMTAYLIQVGNQATVGFTLSALNRERAEAFDEFENSSRRVREMQSLTYVKERAKSLGMVETQELVHLKPDTGVALAP